MPIAIRRLCAASIALLLGISTCRAANEGWDSAEAQRYFVVLDNAIFSWCTGKPMPLPGTDLASLDQSCALLAETDAGMIRRTLAMLIDPTGALRDPSSKSAGDLAIFMTIYVPTMLCEAMTERRAGHPLKKGECTASDPRMDGSDLDLAGTLRNHRDQVPHYMGYAPGMGGPMAEDALPQAARQRILHRAPIGSPLAAAISWLSDLGCQCKNSRCSFAFETWSYDYSTKPRMPHSHYEWTIIFAADGAGLIQDVRVELSGSSL